MASGHHKRAGQRRWSSRGPRISPGLVRIVAPALAATLATGAVLAAAVAWPEEPRTPASSAAVSRIGGAGPAILRDVPRNRDEAVSRSARRVSLEPAKKKQPPPAPEPARVRRSRVVDHLFMTEALNVWSGPGERYTLLAVLPAGTEVAVTGEMADGQWSEVSYEGLSRWVNAAYLAQEKPQPPPTDSQSRTDEQPRTEVTREKTVTGVGGVSDAPCASGSSVESGLTDDAVLVHRSVCATFPGVSGYGGLRSDGDHSEGLALDIMVPGSSTGDDIAEWVRAHSADLGVSEVLWSQQIWTVQRSSEGWRAMEDRGSDTANHFDHVHVTVYG